MKIQQLFDSMYLVRVALEHHNNPTELTTRIMGEYEIDSREVRDNIDLLEYHYEIVMNGFYSAESLYPKLRTGLKEYFEKYLVEGYIRITEKLPDWSGGAKILDYGAGEGHVANWFRKRFVGAEVQTLDRANSDINVDFEQDPDFYKVFEGHFHMIILSEVLHCKSTVVQQHIIKTCNAMLKPDGILVIVEPVDYVMAYRISKIKKDSERHVLGEHHISELMPYDFMKQMQIKVQKHIFYKYAKVHDLRRGRAGLSQ